MEYRAYPIDCDGHRQPPIVITAECDALAVDQVKQVLDGLPIELWHGSRLVGWFEHTKRGLIAERLIDDVMPPAVEQTPSE